MKKSGSNRVPTTRAALSDRPQAKTSTASARTTRRPFMRGGLFSSTVAHRSANWAASLAAIAGHDRPSGLRADTDPGDADLITMGEDGRRPLRAGDDQHGDATEPAGEQAGDRQHIGATALLQRRQQVEHLGLVDQWIRASGALARRGPHDDVEPRTQRERGNAGTGVDDLLEVVLGRDIAGCVDDDGELVAAQIDELADHQRCRTSRGRPVDQPGVVAVLVLAQRLEAGLRVAGRPAQHGVVGDDSDRHPTP